MLGWAKRLMISSSFLGSNSSTRFLNRNPYESGLAQPKFCMIDDRDDFFMVRVLELAQQGRGLASPNPMIGAVLVKEGRVIGEGFHRYAEKTHAEVCAIEAAGKEAKGSTLYINLP